MGIFTIFLIMKGPFLVALALFVSSCQPNKFLIETGSSGEDTDYEVTEPVPSGLSRVATEPPLALPDPLCTAGCGGGCMVFKNGKSCCQPCCERPLPKLKPGENIKIKIEQVC